MAATGHGSYKAVGCRTCDAWPKGRSFARSLCLNAFDGPLRNAIHALKFQGHRRVGRLLGDALAKRFQEVAGWSGLIPVPLHPARRRERGFNQAELIARGLAARSKTTLYSNALCRTRATAQQARTTSADERELNLAGAFVVRAGARKPGLQMVPVGGTVGLVDDVLTTGATLDACGQAILRVRPDLDLVAVVAGIAVREIDSETDSEIEPATGGTVVGI